MRPSAQSVEHQIAGSLDGALAPVRVLSPSEILVESATRLLAGADLPLRLRQDLHSLKRQTRRVAADRSGFATVLEGMEYVKHPAVAVHFPRALEVQAYLRCVFPALSPEIAHESESDANRGFDVAQFKIRDRKDRASLDELLFAGLVQECATRAVTMSEANEMRVRSVLMSR